MEVKGVSRIFVIMIISAIFFFICGKPSFDNWKKKDVIIKESPEEYVTAPGLTICMVINTGKICIEISISNFCTLQEGP